MIGITVLAALALQTGDILNGDFSSGMDGWMRATYGADPTVAIDSVIRHGSSPSLKVTSAAVTDTAFGQDVKVHPGAVYRLTGWVKTKDLDPHGAPVVGTIQVQENGRILSSGHNHSGDTDWVHESAYFVAPSSGIAHVALFMFGWGRGTGTAWFSGIKLEELKSENIPMKITREPQCPGRINPMQYGQFIEYLCDLVPSMWAEKLYDGSFEGLSPYKFKFTVETDFKEKGWYPFGQVTRLKVDQDTSTCISGTSSKHILLGDGAPSSAGIAQDGLSLNKGKACKFSVYVKGVPGATMTVRLFHNQVGFAEAKLPVTDTWTKVSAVLTPSATDANATISITFRGNGSFWLDNASLMPEDTVGGWRKDVVKVLTAIKPGVIRVGGSVLDDANLGTFEWSDTIGDPDKRVPFRAWGGLQPTGAGLEEVVQLIQAVKAEPLICLRYEKKSPADAAREVEYFNGPVDSPMGALRAKNGHPKPYGIKYWQIGNERWGEEYWKAVPEFAKAILEVDPKAQLLTSFPSAELVKLAAPYVSYVSPHQYNVADLSGSRQELEDTRKLIQENGGGKALKIGVTEWNTTAGDAGLPRAMLWSLDNALACSRYQNLMHREADLVEIANRSNLTNSFCSGIIQTNRSGLYLTPTYYAQFLYANLAGTRPLKIESELPIDVAPDTSATLSEDGKWLTLFFVNQTESALTRSLDLSEFGSDAQDVEVWTLGDSKKAGEPDAVNSFAEPERIAPVASRFHAGGAKFEYRFEPLTLTALRWRVKG
ncbi:MAG: alpha-L-arabinofuranosidase C-terminal domain-containing protein [Fimbriimonas sp.]|nr:alpha-L-arabinofuranosidase C-terminal domain-containing protein [Fimbriimonas sp.]